MTRDGELSDVVKADVALAIADADKKLVDGADEALQLLHIACVVNKAYQSASQARRGGSAMEVPRAAPVALSAAMTVG